MVDDSLKNAQRNRHRVHAHFHNVFHGIKAGAPTRPSPELAIANPIRGTIRAARPLPRPLTRAALCAVIRLRAQLAPMPSPRSAEPAAAPAKTILNYKYRLCPTPEQEAILSRTMFFIWRGWTRLVRFTRQAQAAIRAGREASIKLELVEMEASKKLTGDLDTTPAAAESNPVSLDQSGREQDDRQQ